MTKEKHETNNPWLHIKEVEKWEWFKPQIRRKEIISQIRNK
jgi:hypothetical protein